MYSTKQLHDRTLVINTDKVINGGENIPNIYFYNQKIHFDNNSAYLDYLITNNYIYYTEYDLKNTKYEKEYIIDSWEHRIKTRLDAIK